MAQVIIPLAELDAPDVGGDSILPKGSWLGTVEEVFVKPLHEKMQGEGRGYATPEKVKILSIQFGNNQPLDGQEEVRVTQKHFTSFVIKDGDITLETFNVDANGDSWQMARRMKPWGRLARALEATEVLMDEEGKEIVVIAEDFQGNLIDQLFEGTQISFSVTHKPWVSKNGERSGTEVITKEFFQAV